MDVSVVVFSEQTPSILSIEKGKSQKESLKKQI